METVYAGIMLKYSNLMKNNLLSGKKILCSINLSHNNIKWKGILY